MRKLSPRQELFVKEYLIDLNATQAAIRAGYSIKTAQEQAYQLLQKPSVQAAIAEAKKDRSAQTQIDANYVLNRLVEIDQMDVLDILTDEGNIKPVRDWPKVWRITLSGMDVNRLSSLEGSDGQTYESIMQKIKWPDKVKNLEMIGKHVTVGAFKEKLELSGGLTLSHEQMLDELE